MTTTGEPDAAGEPTSPPPPGAGEPAATPPGEPAAPALLAGSGAPDPPVRPAVAGGQLLKASWTGAAVFVVTAGLAAAVPAADIPALVVALALFAGGTVAFAVALLRAAARSRHEELTMSGLFFLDRAPKAVRRRFFGALAIQVVAAFVTAGLRPNTSLAFGILAPMWGEGLAALWAARHGAFPPRLVPTTRAVARGQAGVGKAAAPGGVDPPTVEVPAVDPPADPPGRPTPPS